MDCITTFFCFFFFFHWLWKRMQRIPLTSKERKSMGRGFFVLFYFLNWEEMKSTSEKAAWIWLDTTGPRKQTVEEGGGSCHRSATCFLSCFSATLRKDREGWTAEEGAGFLFYRAGAWRNQNSCHQVRVANICVFWSALLFQFTTGLEDEWSTPYVTSSFYGRVLRKPGFAMTIICC